MGLSVPQIAVSVIRDDLRPPLPKATGENGENDYMDLMINCWDREPTVRWTFGIIMERLDSVTKALGGASGFTGSGSGSSSSSAYSQAKFQPRAGSSHQSSKSDYGSGSSNDAVFETSLRRVPRKDVSYVVCDLIGMNDMWQKDPFGAERAVERYGRIGARPQGEERRARLLQGAPPQRRHLHAVILQSLPGGLLRARDARRR